MIVVCISCVAISTKSALREMVAPGALVILAPLITGTFFGVHVWNILTTYRQRLIDR